MVFHGIQFHFTIRLETTSYNLKWLSNVLEWEELINWKILYGSYFIQNRINSKMIRGEVIVYSVLNEFQLDIFFLLSHLPLLVSQIVFRSALLWRMSKKPTKKSIQIKFWLRFCMKLYDDTEIHFRNYLEIQLAIGIHNACRYTDYMLLNPLW